MSEFWHLYLILEAMFAIALTVWYFILPKDGLWFYPIYFAVASLVIATACYISVSRRKQAMLGQEKLE